MSSRLLTMGTVYLALLAAAAGSLPPACAQNDPTSRILSLRTQMQTLLEQQKLAEAARAARAALEAESRYYGKEHPFVADTWRFLAQVQQARGESAEAKASLTKSRAIRSKLEADLQRRLAEFEKRAQASAEHVAKDGPERAARLLEDNLHRAFNLLDDQAQNQSEQLQREMVESQSVHLDRYFSFAASFPQKRPPYVAISNWKGATMTRQRRASLERRSISLARPYARLDKINAEVAAIMDGPPDRREVRSRLQQLTKRRDALQAEIARRRYSMPKYMSPPVELVLPRDVVMIDYYQYRARPEVMKEPRPPTGQLRLAAIVVRSQRSAQQPLLHLDLGPLKPIERALQDWRTNIQQGGGAVRGDRRIRRRTPRKRVQVAPQEMLYRQIWKPLQAHLRPDDLALISPDGLLAFTPFAALPSGKDKYLIETRPIALAPTPRLIQRLRSLASLSGPKRPASGSAGSGLLLIGGVDFDAPPRKSSTEPPPTGGSSFSFAPLPGSQAEAEELSRLFRSARANEPLRILRGADAREAAVRKHGPQARWLHLATHGFFRPSEGDATGGSPSADRLASVRNGLALAGINQGGGPPSNNGVLTALEVASLNLNGVDLAVLSACETGLGATLRGEGVLGLQRAFQAAGCRTSITTLWRVHDQATQVLMREFYRNLWNRKLSKLESLRQAQLAMLRGQLPVGSATLDGRDKQGQFPPAYWAAFTLSGDWR